MQIKAIINLEATHSPCLCKPNCHWLPSSVTTLKLAHSTYWTFWFIWHWKKQWRTRPEKLWPPHFHSLSPISEWSNQSRHKQKLSHSIEMVYHMAMIEVRTSSGEASKFRPLDSNIVVKRIQEEKWQCRTSLIEERRRQPMSLDDELRMS